MDEHYDVAVLGGGPAGCATAVGLSRLGHKVALITRPRRAPAIEGLSARTEKALIAAGLEAVLETLGPEVERRASWNGVTSAVNRERIVNRARFDARLLDGVRTSGVTLIDARVGASRKRENGYSLTLWTARERRRELTAGFIVEARGRQAPRHGGRSVATPATVAVIRRWRTAAAKGTFSATASFADGWAWFAGADDGWAVLQIFVSADKGMVPAKAGLAEFYKMLVAGIPETEGWLDGARAVGPVAARAAGPVLSEPSVAGGVLRVGDAAIALDPLSGHGIFEGLGCATAAIPTINTLLGKPGRAGTAKEFYRCRAGTRFLHAVGVGAQFYAGEERWPEQPFWRDRREVSGLDPSYAYQAPKAPVVARRPVVDGDLIALDDVIVTPDYPRGVWRIAGVRVAPLLAYLTGGEGTLEDAARAFEAPQEDIATARDWLRYRRLLD